MPARPDILRASAAPRRPDGVPAGLWSFPVNLAEWGNSMGLSQADIAAAAGVNQSTVSRWLHYRGVTELRARHVLLLEERLGLPLGTLLRPHEAYRGVDAALRERDLEEFADAASQLGARARKARAK